MNQNFAAVLTPLVGALVMWGSGFGVSPLLPPDFSVVFNPAISGSNLFLGMPVAIICALGLSFRLHPFLVRKGLLTYFVCGLVSGLCAAVIGLAVARFSPVLVFFIVWGIFSGLLYRAFVGRDVT